MWIWTAIDAKTRLLINFFVGDRTLESCRQFMEKLTATLSGEKPLFTSDELISYATMLKEIYSETIAPEPTGKPGIPRNPKKVVHEDLDYGTVHKTRENGKVVKVEKKIVFGDMARIMERLNDSPSRTINTSFVERLNGILRQMDAHLKRKALTFAKVIRWFKAKLALVAAYYNFCRSHGTLSRNSDRSTTPRTPAMVAGVADHLWNIDELLGTPYPCNG